MTFLEDWNARHLARYREEYAAGKHDVRCEQRERSGICHCSKRRREAEGKTELPALFFDSPWCDGCNEHVEHDGDSFTCPTCRVSWSTSATDGDRADHFTDDYSRDGSFGGEQFGKRLAEIVGGAS